MLFTVDMEVQDSAVTLSPALARYMAKKNQGEEKELKVMPFKIYVNDCSCCDKCLSQDHPEDCPKTAYYGWDINPDPEETGLPKDYVDRLDMLQWNDEERSVGFLMDHPNVVGLLVEYDQRIRMEQSLDTGKPVRMMVSTRVWHGRLQYIIERTPWEERTVGQELRLWWSRWRVRLMRK